MTRLLLAALLLPSVALAQAAPANPHTTAGLLGKSEAEVRARLGARK